MLVDQHYTGCQTRKLLVCHSFVNRGIATENSSPSSLRPLTMRLSVAKRDNKINIWSDKKVYLSVKREKQSNKATSCRLFSTERILDIYRMRVTSQVWTSGEVLLVYVIFCTALRGDCHKCQMQNYLSIYRNFHTV